VGDVTETPKASRGVGPTSKGRGREGREGDKMGGGKERRGKGREGKGGRKGP